MMGTLPDSFRLTFYQIFKFKVLVSILYKVLHYSVFFKR
jgi:hypothetical protein